MMKSASERMCAAAAASLALAGAVALTGCRSEVMDDRPYQPLDKTQVQPAAPVEVVQPVKPAPAVPKYQPMSAPAVKPAATAPSTPAKATVPSGTYTVKKGDTMGAIAKRSGVKLNALLKANNMDMKSANRIQIGQKIVIPGGNAGKAAPAGKSARNPKKAPAETAAKAIPAGLLNADGTYTVKRGDSIPRIARKLGVKASALQQANNLSDEATRRLQIGQKLVVPGKPAAVTTKSAPAVKADPEAAKLIEAAEKKSAAGAAVSSRETKTNDSASEFVPVPAEMTVAEFAKSKGITVEQFLQLNAEFKAEDKLTKDQYVFVPVK